MLSVNGSRARAKTSDENLIVHRSSDALKLNWLFTSVNRHMSSNLSEKVHFIKPGGRQCRSLRTSDFADETAVTVSSSSSESSELRRGVQVGINFRLA